MLIDVSTLSPVSTHTSVLKNVSESGLKLKLLGSMKVLTVSYGTKGVLFLRHFNPETFLVSSFPPSLRFQSQYFLERVLVSKN